MSVFLIMEVLQVLFIRSWFGKIHTFGLIKDFIFRLDHYRVHFDGELVPGTGLDFGGLTDRKGLQQARKVQVFHERVGF